MTESALSFDLGITLRYQHGLGDLSPYFSALMAGEALATHCAACERTWFAPRLICRCGNRDVAWRQLEGGGVVRYVTRGRAVLPGTAISDEFDYALIQLDGASNLCLGRMAPSATASEPDQRVRLVQARRSWAHPSQACDFSIDVSAP